ncbi:MAG: hypothetical protein RL596_808 [Bacteroidota bacterium]|jgi:hypothetical protein
MNFIRLLFSITCVILLSCKGKPIAKLNLDGLKPKDSIKYFKIFNTGTENLIIENFTTSCECTELGLTKNQVIKSNDSLLVRVLVSKVQDTDNTVFITIKTNSNPRLLSFHFLP